MGTQALMDRVKARADTLVNRAEVLDAMIETGEGSSAHQELAMIADEMKFLARLSRGLLQGLEMRVLRARFEATEARLRHG